ncbi:hypothetical protein FOYG_00637 [Fusarium oxysporum NRRL 32931]|uniref:Uncharacterized protein n=1 Tax=Fusarium oxysporum NRRL 32931 TaxID=660029 RepID=W9J5T2_FUSOX|nr:hypothetical protein FOYG_00637 [Fusarium oxysporum NRRL 32931]
MARMVNAVIHKVAKVVNSNVGFDGSFAVVLLGQAKV